LNQNHYGEANREIQKLKRGEVTYKRVMKILKGIAKGEESRKEARAAEEAVKRPTNKRGAEVLATDYVPKWTRTDKGKQKGKQRQKGLLSDKTKGYMKGAQRQQAGWPGKGGTDWKPKCPHGAQCKWAKDGKCRNFHTKAELERIRGGGGAPQAAAAAWGGDQWKAGDWECGDGQCKAHNFASRATCFKCGKQKPGGVVKEEKGKAKGPGKGGKQKKGKGADGGAHKGW